jgi:hypothetical protein
MRTGKVLNYRIQVEVYFPKSYKTYEDYANYLATMETWVDEDHLGSGYDIFTFETKTERTKVLRDLKNLGVPNNVIVLSKEVVG